MHFRKTLISISILIFILVSGCKKKSEQISQTSDVKQKLSEYGFFEGKLSDLSPRADVLPYDLNTPLFTDYAHKSRFVWMPKGSSATYTTDHVLEFPKGTVLIKNFYYYHDERKPEQGKRIIETRLMIKDGKCLLTSGIKSKLKRNLTKQGISFRSHGLTTMEKR